MATFVSRAKHGFDLLGQAGDGWRRPQLGALGAIIAHWSLSHGEPTLVSVPTGAGKTGSALAAGFVAAGVADGLLAGGGRSSRRRRR